MGAISFEVSEGASVQVVVGRQPLLALPHEPSVAAEAPEPRRGSRSVVKGLLAAALLGGGFMLGQHTHLAPVHAPLADAASFVAPAPVTKAFPDHQLAAAAAPPQPAPRVPPAFTQQLREPPTVLQPPGSVAPVANAFGLDH